MADLRMTEQTGSKTQRFYDRIADAHNVALKLNGYRGSLVRYLKSIDPDLGPDSMVLDAGSGTGIVTLGLHSAGFKPKRTVTFDLSYNSLSLGLGQFKKDDNKEIFSKGINIS